MKSNKSLIQAVTLAAALSGCDQKSTDLNTRIPASPSQSVTTGLAESTNAGIANTLIYSYSYNNGPTEKERIERLSNIKKSLIEFIKQGLKLIESNDKSHYSETKVILEKVLHFCESNFSSGYSIELVSPEEMESGAGATFSFERKEIILSTEFNCNNFLDLSMLLHETIHAWQDVQLLESEGRENYGEIRQWEVKNRLVNLENEVIANLIQIEILNLFSSDSLRESAALLMPLSKMDDQSAFKRELNNQREALANILKGSSENQRALITTVLRFASNYYSNPNGGINSLEKIPRSFIGSLIFIYNTVGDSLYEYTPHEDLIIDPESKGCYLGDGISPLKLEEGMMFFYPAKGNPYATDITKVFEQ